MESLTKTKPQPKQEPSYKYIIENKDVGKYSLTLYTEKGEMKNIYLSNSIGYIQKIDIGKTLILTAKGNIQMSN